MISSHIIVAGGAGFIGSHLCEKLIHSGKKVIAIDDLSTGTLENLSDLYRHPDFAFLNHNIIDPFHIDGNIEAIYNLACPASPKQYGLDPIKTFLTSIVGSKNLLDLALEKRARILLASTSEIYGDPSISPQSENYCGNVNPVGERSCYDEGKRGAETLFNDYNRCLGVDTRIIRIFNTYGPRMSPKDGRVIPTFITQALKKKPLTINGSGEQTRSFMYIDNLIDAITGLMEPGVTHSPVNIGNPEEITINRLAEIISDILDEPLILTHNPLPADDPQKRCPDISRVSDILDGWKPTVDIRKGLERTINYFRNKQSFNTNLNYHATLAAI